MQGGQPERDAQYRIWPHQIPCLNVWQKSDKLQYHKPLAAVLKKFVTDSPVRLRTMLSRIMGYNLEFKYVKGKYLLIADALSVSQTANLNQSKSEKKDGNYWSGY